VKELLLKVIAEQRAPIVSLLKPTGLSGGKGLSRNKALGSLRMAREQRKAIRLPKLRPPSYRNIPGTSRTPAARSAQQQQQQDDEAEEDLYEEIDDFILNAVNGGGGISVAPSIRQMVGFVGRETTTSDSELQATLLKTTSGDTANPSALEHLNELSLSRHHTSPPVPEPHTPTTHVWHGSLSEWRSHMRDHHKHWVASPPGHGYSGPTFSTTRPVAVIMEDLYGIA
jgi:hypothetical protein